MLFAVNVYFIAPVSPVFAEDFVPSVPPTSIITASPAFVYVSLDMQELVGDSDKGILPALAGIRFINHRGF